MILRPFFGLYGSKWRAALRYPPPTHQTIVESFAGSAGYALRYYDREVILSEKDEIIYGVWDYLLHTSAEEILSLPDLEPGETIYDLEVCQEAQWLIGFWLNRGVARPRPTPSGWMLAGVSPTSFWGDRARKTIAFQVDWVRHWKIYHCSYEELPFSGEATWFIDPPYQGQGRYYYHGPGELNFANLGDWCRSRPGQVIVCENEGADWLPFEPLASSRTARDQASLESVWLR